ncbi:MAG TPA: hypothetical protein VF641_12190 [Methylobacterium sp.]|jgi:hypothetical protein
MRRPCRDFDALSEAQVVAGLTSARRVSTPILTRAGASQRIGDLIQAIDHVAEVATGDRSFLHLKPGSAADAVRRHPDTSTRSPKG